METDSSEVEIDSSLMETDSSLMESNFRRVEMGSRSLKKFATRLVLRMLAKVTGHIIITKESESNHSENKFDKPTLNLFVALVSNLTQTTDETGRAK